MSKGSHGSAKNTMQLARATVADTEKFLRENPELPEAEKADLRRRIDKAKKSLLRSQMPRRL